MSCEYETLIDRRVLGDLPPDELLTLRAHIAGCAACEARFEEAGAMERLLVGAFREIAPRLRSPREAVLGAIERGLAPAPASPRRERPVRLFGRRPGLFLLVNAIAAASILAAALGYVYLGLVNLERQALTTQARVEVRNLAILLRERVRGTQASPGAADLQGALTALGLERDAFGHEFRIDPEGARLYSPGPNGRDERGGGDDIVASVARR